MLVSSFFLPKNVVIVSVLHILYTTYSHYRYCCYILKDNDFNYY